MRLTEAKRSQDVTNRRSFSLNREMDVALYTYRTSKGFRKEADAVRDLVAQGLTLIKGNPSTPEDTFAPV
jgi:hypothetical protein